MSIDQNNSKSLRTHSLTPVKNRPSSTAIAGVALSIALATGPASSRETVSGVWYDDSGKGAVQLYQCGSNICGRIYWLRQPVNRAGTPLRDAYNPQSSRRNRPICGLQVISGVKPQGDGSWDGGRIYDPKVGKSYDVAIDQLNNKRLRITGYLGARFLGKSFIWRRAPANLAQCHASK